MEQLQSRTLDAIRRDVLPYLPDPVRREVLRLPEPQLARLEEIRLRQGRPLMLVFHDGDLAVDYLVAADDMTRGLQLMSQSSVYALEEELRQGYLTLNGGHRVGFVGRAVVERGHIRTLKHIAGMNVRISREMPGVAASVLPWLLTGAGRGYQPVLSTLIVGPPRSGKTTLLRDICRQLAGGLTEWSIPGLKVGLVDERSEVAGCHHGVPQRDVGLRTDVLDGCPKAEGIMLLIRSMSPDIVVTDELGRSEDSVAVEEAANAGVTVIATVHGSDSADLGRRPSLRQLMTTGVFRRLVFLSRSRGPGTLADITDESGVSVVHRSSAKSVSGEVNPGVAAEVAG